MKTRFIFRSPDDALMQCVRQDLRLFLGKHGLRASASIVETVLSELIQNAIKANLKRSFFLENKLDLKRDYAKGNNGFRTMLAEDSRRLIDLSKKHRLEVHVTFKIGKEILISVWNPSIAIAEQARIKKSLAQKQIKPGSDALAEGAGFGLTMSTSLLRGLGLVDALKFKADKKGGSFTIHIPRGVQVRSAAAKKITRFIAARLPLPVLSETLVKLGKAPNETQLREQVLDDPALFVNVLGTALNLRKKKNFTAVTSPDAILLAHQALRLAGKARAIAAAKKLPVEKAARAALVDSIGLYFLYSLNPTNLGELRKITGRGKPSVEPALRESTIGINPEVLSGLLLTSAGIRISPMTAVLNEARNSLEND